MVLLHVPVWSLYQIMVNNKVRMTLAFNERSIPFVITQFHVSCLCTGTSRVTKLIELFLSAMRITNWLQEWLQCDVV